MKQNEINILLVEDNPGDVRLMQEILSESKNLRYRLKNVNRLSSCIEALAEEKFDIIVLDFGLPDSNGLETLTKLQNQSLTRTPVVVLTGLDDERTSIKAVEMGAQDYIVKGQLNPDALSRTLRYAIWRFQAMEDLRHKVALENLIMKISTKFINFKAEEIDSGINQALNDIGKFMNADRSYFFQIDGGVLKSKISTVYEWCSGDSGSLIDKFKNFELGRLPWLSKKMIEMDIIPVPDVSQLPPEAAAEKQLFIEAGIKSLYLVPITHSSSLFGFIGYDSIKEEKVWTEESNSLLKITGEIFLNALQRKEGENLLKRYQLLSENAKEIVMFVACDTGDIIEANNAAVQEYGFTRQELLKMNVSDFRGFEGAEVFEQRMEQSYNGITYETYHRRKDGSMFPVEINSQGSIIDGKRTIMSIIHNITERKKAEMRLNYMAYYDNLTAIPNRLLFNDRLNQLIARAKRLKSSVVVMLLDLDAFKEVNDTLGHHVGDLLLQEVAKRLKECIRDTDTVARLGGDEFTLLCPDIQTAMDATSIATKVIQLFTHPFVIKKNVLKISASIGISIYPKDGDTEEIIVKNADIAMYQAKNKGKNNFQFFDSSLNPLRQ